jgi:signal transduction histidine kinase
VPKGAVDGDPISGVGRVNCAGEWGASSTQSRNRRICGRKGLVLQLVLAASLLLISSGSAAGYPSRKNVLIINQVGLSHRIYLLVTEAIQSRLTRNPDYQIEFYSESLDSMSLTDEALQREIQSRLAYRFSNLKLDAVVAVGPEPIRFISGISTKIFPDVPVVFCGGIEGMAGPPRLDSRFTGSWLKLEPAKTIDAALRLFPETRNIIVVGGTSAFDRAIQTLTRDGLRSYEGRLDFTHLTDLEMSALLERLRRLPDKTIVLYTSFFQDAAGSHFINATSALPMVAEASVAPVFGMSDTYLGQGIVGGYVLSFAEQGKIAARILSELLGGKKPEDIPIVTGPNVYMFDWRELQRWGLRESNLPPGSAVLYREPTLWERAKWTLFAGLLVILTLASLTGYLLLKQKQLKLAREAQAQLSGMLITAQEAERSRLASELHDDFSQRLAILALDLETAAETIPKSPQEASLQLHRLLNSASEIGADLHTLSRRLHPSTLENLGLIPGVSAFCREFAAQQSMQVDFSPGDIPRSVPPEAALCLFRIVQEGLRNSKKHSGASNAQVGLEMVGDALHVSVCDQGAGFNVKEGLNNGGLGLRSMGERARLLGGRFEIHSEPRRGTRIDAWVPIQPHTGTEFS